MFGQIHANGSRTTRAHLPSLAKSTLVPSLVFGHPTLLFMFVRCYLIYLCIILGINFISIFLIFIIIIVYIIIIYLVYFTIIIFFLFFNFSRAF